MHKLSPIMAGMLAFSDAVSRRVFTRVVLLAMAVLAMAGNSPLITASEIPNAVAPAEKNLSPEWLQSLTVRGTPTVCRGEDLKRIGMPIGGLFAGQLYLAGDGRLWHWDIFNDAIFTTGTAHYATPMPQTSPLEQGFALRVTQNGKTEVRTLDAAGFPDVTFTGQYPIGLVNYAATGCPVAVALEAFSPFVPLDFVESSYPATILRFTLTNNSSQPAAVQIGGWLENKLCLRTAAQWKGFHKNRIGRDNSLLMLECSARPAVLEPKTELRPKIIFANFEGSTFDGWTVEGNAFGERPAGVRTEGPKLRGIVGKALADSYAVGGETPTGKLTSRPFKIERRFINFTLGGGNRPGKECMNLLVDGKVVRSATGENSDKMEGRSWDVGDLQGRTGMIEIVDAASDKWGHIQVDQIEFADASPMLPARLEEAADFGTMALALLDAQASDIAATDVCKPYAEAIFAAASDAVCEQPFATPLVGSLACSLTLAPGESKTVSFVLTWHFPNLSVPTNSLNCKPTGRETLLRGRHYATRFDSATAVARAIAAKYPQLHAQTRLWHDTWYDSTLPHWLLDRTFANISTLATSTSYRFADGLYWAFEGVGNCPGTCNHVYGYEQAVGRLFPELDRLRLEMADFNPAIGFNEKDGSIAHRVKCGRGPAFDGQAMTLLRLYRDHQMSADDAFLRRHWPQIKQAIQWFIRQDDKQEGLIFGPQANTLDGVWYGMVPWLSSLYIATLRAGEQMATEVGDAEFSAQCRVLAEAGMKNFAPRMFNGEYFEQISDPTKLDHVGSYNGCEIDQVLGQQWAFQVGLGRILPEAETKKALASIWRYNFFPDVGPFRASHPTGRWYAKPGEAGTVMCAWPKGERMRVPKGYDFYLNECMNGFEHQVAAHMIWEGMVEQGLAVERAVHDRYAASRRNPYNEVECGDHYGRSMASYGVFTAVCGYEYHGPKGYLAFAPRISPENFRAAFTAAEGWGTFSQEIKGEVFHASLKLKWGQLSLQTLVLTAAKAPANVEVKLCGRTIPATFATENNRITIRFSERCLIRAGEELTVVQLMDEQRLYERGSRRVYRGEYLKAISLPIGGIAAGPVQINGQARRHSWQIFRNFEGVDLPNSFFAVRAQVGDSAGVVRVLQTVGEGPFQPMKELSFSGEYPFGWFDFQEPKLPVKVSMEVFSPLIPLNAKDSSIPCAIFNLTAENIGKTPAHVSFLATQRNPLGCQPEATQRNPLGCQPEVICGGNINQVVREHAGCMIHFRSNRPQNHVFHMGSRYRTDAVDHLPADWPKDHVLTGDMALATTAPEVKATAQWTSRESLLDEFARGGALQESETAGPTPAGETADAALAVPFLLKPGEKRTVTFVLTWYFPNSSFMADKRHFGSMYQNWWPDALGVARDVLGRMEPLTAQTRLYNEAFYQTNLPYWLLDRISSQVAVLGAMNFHWAKDGFFYAYEGCNPTFGACAGNATHVWGYAQAHARLFPEIARRMREQELAVISPEGWLPTRFPGAGGADGKRPAFDGSCHEISAVLREHQLCSDPAWLAGRWPAVRRAMDYMIQCWDSDEDGMLHGPQFGMDGYQGGTSSWMGSCYLSALASAAKIARLQNEIKVAERYETILKRGQANQDKALFNGEYFAQVPDPKPCEDYVTGCYIDQMLGQWWALQNNNGWLYPREHVKSAMAALFKHNFHPDFHSYRQWPRVFCKEDDAGLIQCSWPQGGQPPMKQCIRYYGEVMSGFEYCAATLMIQAGCVREGFTVLRAAADRYDGRLREFPDKRKRPIKELHWWNWGYSGNPFGDDECGKFYVRAMAIWSVPLACQGFEYDAATGTMGFAPIWKPENHVSFFTAAEGWGTFSQEIKGKVLHASLDLKWGKLSLQTLVLTAPMPPSKVEIKLRGRAIPVKSFTANENRIEIRFSESTLIRAGENLDIILE